MDILGGMSDNHDGMQLEIREQAWDKGDLSLENQAVYGRTTCEI